MAKQEEYVLRTVEERGIRFIRLWFTDVLGYLKSFAITPAELETVTLTVVPPLGDEMLAIGTDSSVTRGVSGSPSSEAPR